MKYLFSEEEKGVENSRGEINKNTPQWRRCSRDADANEYDLRTLRMTNGNILQPNPDKVWPLHAALHWPARSWYGTIALWQRSVSFAYSSQVLWSY